MDKKKAQIIYNTPDEKLIELWKQIALEDYLALRKTMTDERIVEIIKGIAEDVLNDKASEFKMTDEKGNKYIFIEYLGEK